MAGPRYHRQLDRPGDEAAPPSRRCASDFANMNSLSRQSDPRFRTCPGTFCDKRNDVEAVRRTRSERRRGEIARLCLHGYWMDVRGIRLAQGRCVDRRSVACGHASSVRGLFEDVALSDRRYISGTNDDSRSQEGGAVSTPRAKQDLPTRAAGLHQSPAALGPKTSMPRSDARRTSKNGRKATAAEVAAPGMHGSQRRADRVSRRVAVLLLFVVRLQDYYSKFVVILKPTIYQRPSIKL